MLFCNSLYIPGLKECLIDFDLSFYDAHLDKIIEGKKSAFIND